VSGSFCFRLHHHNLRQSRSRPEYDLAVMLLHQDASEQIVVLWLRFSTEYHQHRCDYPLWMISSCHFVGYSAK
jgi:hypothetical protein